VEVDRSALLVLGDLGVGDAGLFGEFGVGQAEHAG
jgi:hypothetical protein